MNSTINHCTVIFLFVFASSCFGCQEKPQKDPFYVDPEAVELLNNATNVSTQDEMPSDKPTIPRVKSIDQNSIQLSGLDLIFREVNFDNPIDGRFSIYVSETEITNEMYADYLADTNRIRDDSELEAASKVGTYSTASRMVSIRDSDSLWKENQIPEGREEHPVSLLSYNQVENFCKWIKEKYELDGIVRLPTEAEWLVAAYGSDRKYPWGDEELEWNGKSTEPVRSHPELRTPDGLYGMWGNVSELVLSPSNGYGGIIPNNYEPIITCWQGPSYLVEEIAGKAPQPRQDYWGYTHSRTSVSDDMGFRVVFVPKDLPIDSKLEAQIIGEWKLNSGIVISTLIFKRDKTFSATRTDNSKILSKSQKGLWGVDVRPNWLIAVYGVIGKVDDNSYEYNTGHPYQVVSPNRMISGSGEVFKRVD